MDLVELIERAAALVAEIEDFDLEDTSDEAVARAEAAEADLVSVNGEIDALRAVELERAERRETELERARVAIAADRVVREPGSPEHLRRVDPWADLDLVARGRADDLVSRAQSAIEAVDGTTDAAQGTLTRMVEGAEYVQQDHEGDLARLTLVSTDPAYVEAFSLGAAGREAEMTDRHRLAVSRVRAVKRAMSTTDNAGGYLIPMHIDPVLLMSADGNADPISDLARVVPTTSDVLRGVSSGNAAWSWDAENVEVSDDATTFANTDVTLYTGRGYVPVSLEAIQSIPDVAMHVQAVITEGYRDLVAASNATGTGSSQPFGIVTALTAKATASATTDVFAVADLYAVDEALAPRFRNSGRASWIGNRAIINLIRQFGTADSHAFTGHLTAGQPMDILGHPLFECSGMDSSVTAAADNYILVLGDFSNFWIGLGMGMNIEFVPQTFGGNGRPTGGRGWFAYSRYGSDSVNDAGFEMLNVT